MTGLSFFSSPIGLGHVTRDAAIAEHLKDVQVRFVTGGAAAKFLAGGGFDVMDLYKPPLFHVEGGSLKNKTRWLWDYYRYYKKCKCVAKKIIEKDRPDIIVSDEDFASLAVAQEMNIPTVLITDVLETHFTNGIMSIIEKKMNQSMKEIIKRCNKVIMPEAGHDLENIKRVGPIVRQTERTREELRERFAFDKKTVLVSVGGTDAGVFLIEKALEAMTRIKSNVHMAIASGPSLAGRFSGQRNDMGFVDNLHEMIYAADVLVSLAGKSTIDEAKAYGTPGIFIPIKGHFEQEDNAKAEGFCFEDVNRLAELISERLDKRKRKNMNDSASDAAGIIRGIL